MKIGVNLRFRHQRTTGVQRYAEEVVSSLAARDDVTVVDWSFRDNGLGSRIREITGVGSRQYGGDAVLNLCNWSPILRQKGHVVVVHDLLPIEQPAAYSPTYVKLVRAQMAALRQGEARVVTVSERSQRDLEAYLGRPVAIAPGGVRPPREIDPTGFRPGAGPGRYVLMVGAHDPRKNAVFALGLQPALRDRGLQLVLTARGSLSNLFQGGSQNLDDAMLITDPSDDQLWSLYQGAEILLHPSKAEGFGLPLLEAASVGTPAISTPVGAAEEILGAEELIRPLDVPAWLGAIDEVLVNRSSYAMSMSARSAQFTWDRTAGRLVEECRVLM